MNTKRLVATTLSSLALLSGVALTSCQNKAERVDLKSREDSLSYAFGFTVGCNYSNGMDRIVPGGDTLLNREAIIAGFITAMRGDTANTLITLAEARELKDNFFEDLRLQKAYKEAEEYRKMKVQNDVFMEEAAKETGMQALPKPYEKYDGPCVLMKELAPGRGDTIGSKKFVLVNMTIKLANDTVVYSTDESKKRMMPVSRISPRGLKQAISCMRKGGKAKVVVPCELGFGRQPKGPIPANSILVYDLEIERVFDNEKEARSYNREMYLRSIGKWESPATPQSAPSVATTEGDGIPATKATE